MAPLSRRDECEKCDEPVLVVPYLAPDSTVEQQIELDAEPVAFFVPTKAGWTIVYGHLRHRASCEEAPPRLIGGAPLADEAGDEAGDSTEDRELSAPHAPPDPGTS